MIVSSFVVILFSALAFARLQENFPLDPFVVVVVIEILIWPIDDRIEEEEHDGWLVG